MFIYNLKINKNIFFKISIIFMIIIAILILIIAIYNIFYKSSSNGCSRNSSKIEITNDNYTNILKSINDDIDSYIGQEIHFTGYIYRLIDFKENEFVLARDMVVDNNNQSLIVGFLCNFKNANNFSDNTWVDVTGKISKGNYHGDVAIVNVSNMFKIEKPEDTFVYPPDKTYIPTVSM